MNAKRLYRSRTNRVISGVFGGLGEYLNTDPNILRIAWIIITVFTGFIPGIIVYLLAALIIPEK
jgi:phage shock protein C